MLPFISRFASPKSPVADYNILSDRDKKAIALHLPSSMLNPVEIHWQSIDSAVTIFEGGAALVCLESGRRIHVSSRSFWIDGKQTKAVNAITEIVKEANERESARLVVRQLETERALRLAIQQRRQRQSVSA